MIIKFGFRVSYNKRIGFQPTQLGGASFSIHRIINTDKSHDNRNVRFRCLQIESSVPTLRTVVQQCLVDTYFLRLAVVAHVIRVRDHALREHMFERNE